MRPKNKKHIFITHRQQKIPRTKPQKRKNKQQQHKHYLLLLFLSHSRPLYSSHTTHHPTNNTQPHATHAKRPQPARSCSYKRGDSIEQQPCVAPDTQQHAKQQNKPKHKHTHPCFTDPPHAHKTTCDTCFHLKTKTLPSHAKPTRDNKNLPPPGA